jgi:hypothetical protein
MKTILRYLTIAALCTFAACAIGQDEQPGSSLPIALDLPASGFTCSPGGMLYCYGVSVTVAGQPAGTFWIDGPINPPTYPGFICWFGVADLSGCTGHFTGTSFTKGTFTSQQYGQQYTGTFVSQAVINFAGNTTDVDSGPYSGSMTLNFNWYYSRGGGGRGGGGAGWHYTITSGTIAVNYQ